ncbi:MAG: aldo/keto reductase [Flavobacteriales bacterium]|nr:aldo/keto reductase [Flavobacteriales bacterium]
MKNLTFQNGNRMPVIGLGTWKSSPRVIKTTIIEALKIGYRHVDCAPIYGNEKEIGEAFKECFENQILTRDELWVTSKLWNDSHREEDVRPALESTLSDLQLDYLDLYLIHWPVAFKRGIHLPKNPESYYSLNEVPLAETWKAMQSAQQAGLTRHIGTSNFSINRLQDLKKTVGQGPELNQVELHPYLQQESLLKYCRENGIHTTAYSPLGSMDRHRSMKKDNDPVPLKNEIILKMALKKDISPAQLLISWQLHRGISVIPKSTNPGRLQQNFDAHKIVLSARDMDEIRSIDQHRRIVDGSFFDCREKGYSMTKLWDE